MKLTARQQQILDYLIETIASDGMPPTRAELCRHFGFKSPNAAEDHLRALANKGAIELISGSSRGIRLLVDTPEGLPVVGSVAAGAPLLAVENIDRHIKVDANAFRTSPDYLLRVVGTSMQDIGILDGDLLAVKKTEQVKNGDIVVARLDEEVTVKRLQKGPGTNLQLLPENKNFEPIQVTEQTPGFAIEGLAVGILRDL